jgi:hypothetical protein
MWGGRIALGYPASENAVKTNFVELRECEVQSAPPDPERLAYEEP